MRGFGGEYVKNGKEEGKEVYLKRLGYGMKEGFGYGSGMGRNDD